MPVVTDYTALLAYREDANIRANNPANLGSQAVITYHFATDSETSRHSFVNLVNNFEMGTFSEMSTANKGHVRDALTQLASVCGLVFLEVPDVNDSMISIAQGSNATKVLGFSEFPNPNEVGARTQVFGISPSDLSPGTIGYETVIHELGHAAGLKHPFEGTIRLRSDIDNTTNTVMSYTENPPGVYQTQYRPLDISALTHIYGSAATTSDWTVDLRNGKPFVITNDSANTITGPMGNAVIHTKGGNDRIFARQGDDVIYAGDGNDQIRAGGGNDRVYGGSGNDWITDTRTTFVYGSNDYFDGGTGNDQIQGNYGNDTLVGGSGLDRLFGGSGDDILRGGNDTDRLYGESGDDRLDGGAQDDLVFAGSGADRIWGGTGDDHLSGHAGDDLIFGQVGNDRIYGGSGNDTMYGHSGNDLIYGQSGNDRMYGGTGNDEMIGNTGNDLISGQDGHDKLSGLDGNDKLYGGSGNDQLRGGKGNDRLAGGDGADHLWGGWGADRFVFDTSDLGEVDKIVDFKPGLDIVDLRALPVARGDIDLIASGGNTMLRWSRPGEDLNVLLIGVERADWDDLTILT